MCVCMYDCVCVCVCARMNVCVCVRVCTRAKISLCFIWRCGQPIHTYMQNTPVFFIWIIYLCVLFGGVTTRSVVTAFRKYCVVKCS